MFGTPTLRSGSVTKFRDTFGTPTFGDEVRHTHQIRDTQIRDTHSPHDRTLGMKFG